MLRLFAEMDTGVREPSITFMGAPSDANCEEQRGTHHTTMRFAFKEQTKVKK
jgi:hypothetical protein